MSISPLIRVQVELYTGEIHDELDEIAQSRNVGVLLDATATLAVVVVALELASLVLLTAGAGGASHVGDSKRARVRELRARLETVIYLACGLTVLCQAAVFTVFVDATPKRGAVAAFAVAAAGLGLVHHNFVTARTAPAWLEYAFNAAWQGLGVSYFLTVYGVAKDLRERRTKPSWACLTHPATVQGCKTAAPVLLAAAILAAVLLVP